MPKCGAPVNVVDATALSAEKFLSGGEYANTPLLITGLTETWQARVHWQLDVFKSRLRGDAQFDTSEDETYTTWDEYLCLMQEDGGADEEKDKDNYPSYLFDASFIENHPDLADDFEVPTVFQDDLLTYLFPAPHLRPDYRWLLLGRRQSGLTCHQDPHYTSAWNALIAGKKRWCLFPPATSSALLLPWMMDCQDSRDGDTAPRDRGQVKQKRNTAKFWFENAYEQCRGLNGMLEFEQVPGQVVVIPSMWWHVAIVLENSVAVTQNYLAEAGFPSAYTNFAKVDPGRARRWLQDLPAEIRARVQIAMRQEQHHEDDRDECNHEHEDKHGQNHQENN